MELDGRNPGKDQQARSLSRPGGTAVRCALIRVGASGAREGGAALPRERDAAPARNDGQARSPKRNGGQAQWAAGLPCADLSAAGGVAPHPPTPRTHRARRCGTCCCATGSSRRRRSGAPSGRRATAPGKLLRVADRATASESLIRVASEPLIRVAFESLTRMQPHPASCRRPHGRRRITRIASHCGTELQFLFMFHDETAVAGQVASPVQGRVKLSQKMRTAPFGRAAAAGDARRLLPPTHNF